MFAGDTPEGSAGWIHPQRAKPSASRKRHRNRDSQPESKDPAPGHRSTRYKEKFQHLRDKYDRVLAIRDAIERDLYLAADKMERLQGENDLLLDAIHAASPELMELVSPMPPTRTLPSHNHNSHPPTAPQPRRSNRQQNSNSHSNSAPPLMVHDGGVRSPIEGREREHEGEPIRDDNDHEMMDVEPTLTTVVQLGPPPLPPTSTRRSARRPSTSSAQTRPPTSTTAAAPAGRSSGPSPRPTSAVAPNGRDHPDTSASINVNGNANGLAAPSRRQTRSRAASMIVPPPALPDNVDPHEEDTKR